jgi:beta-glucosidase
LRVEDESTTQSDVNVTVDVKNSGNVDGEEVVQLYVSDKTARSLVPIVALKGFKRVFLKKGEQKPVTFTLTPEDFSVTNSDALQVVEPGTFEIAVGGAVPGKNSVVKAITLKGNAFEIR